MRANIACRGVGVQGEMNRMSESMLRVLEYTTLPIPSGDEAVEGSGVRNVCEGG